MYYMGWTFWDAYHLPINARRWFIQRLKEEMKGKPNEGSADDMDTPLRPGWENSRAPHHNTEDIRGLQERSRQRVPPRLIRFT